MQQESFSSSPISARSKTPTRVTTYLAPLRKTEWVVYAKKPFAGPQQVLAYLARYTHRVAIANSRLLDLDATHVRFRWKDYRENGHHQHKVMRLDVGEFMRRFLLHVLPTRLPSHSSLRAVRQRPPRQQACAMPSAARCASPDNQTKRATMTLSRRHHSTRRRARAAAVV